MQMLENARIIYESGGGWGGCGWQQVTEPNTIYCKNREDGANLEGREYIY